jgi:Uma2 family endonuclease
MSTVAHFSLAEFEHMVEVGAFSGPSEKRLELIPGELRQMSPIGFLHSQVVTLLTDWSYDVVPRGEIVIRVQNPIRIPKSDSEPQPDLVWAARRTTPEHHPHPDHVLLLIEVADASLTDDRNEKLSLYAEAGIAEYWIVNLIDEQVEVYRNPSGRTYDERSIFQSDDEIHPLALTAAALRAGAIV